MAKTYPIAIVISDPLGDLNGHSGWSYTSWQGPFYPPTIEKKKWLPYYSQVFDYVEIDSTFYRVPSKFMVQNWTKRTPDYFRFTTMFPKIITHDKRLRDVHKELGQFFEVMEPPAGSWFFG